MVDKKKLLPSANSFVYIPFLKYEKPYARGVCFLPFCKGQSRFVTIQQVGLNYG